MYTGTMRSQRGFTLFELLVVISIIALLIALATVSFTTAQQNGRDSRRRGDMIGMRNALEQYYAINGSYPDGCTAGNLASVLPNGLPVDPKNDASYEYTFTCTADAYCVCGEVERSGTGNSTTNDCSDMTAGDYFCAQNLQ